MARVVVAHVAITTSPDYVTRREPHRKAHIERLLELRTRGISLAAGRRPTGARPTSSTAWPGRTSSAR